ncbi:5-formyltetrahydrofolate cyclo-ligase [Acuticoccus mangrovi]|uniref:5-formyltetrahydrofolate cyclo-ligase n=1 Tax=Acuticoccus mangrovi TaxID=2796142 RepID=A0A934IRU4_9HYPH|nr:5-formyltetrahydrofolate cyclo-ligase [Acuticoccus mangrovi]MBJ3777591.1 5-formyltetrahydrofolate cyclo-ligase [Acuticoccus mangrovi]
MSLSEIKKGLRRDAMARRAAAAAAAPDAAERLAARAAALPAARTVSAYVAMRDEIDPLPLARALAARGMRLALPVVADKAMSFHAWADGEPLTPGPFGTMEPSGEAATPDLLLVPLLAFTRDGGRLGYGAGHYDRWLAAHPEAKTVGLAYAAQEVEALPIEPHDQPLDAILTEREFIRTKETLCG